MSSLSSVRTFVRPATPAFSIGRALALLAGAATVAVETVMSRAELARSRRQLAQLDEKINQLKKLLPNLKKENWQQDFQSEIMRKRA